MNDQIVFKVLQTEEYKFGKVVKVGDPQATGRAPLQIQLYNYDYSPQTGQYYRLQSLSPYIVTLEPKQIGYVTDFTYNDPSLGILTVQVDNYDPTEVYKKYNVPL